MTKNSVTRVYADKDSHKTIKILEAGRDALEKHDFETAMRKFKKCYKSRITKQLAAILLDQMANCMDRLEFYDEQQNYLEDLVELEPNFKNVQKLMRIYLATNNEPKKKALAGKIRELPIDDDENGKEILTLLVQADDSDEFVKRGQEWLEEHKDDHDTARNILNTYMKQQKIEEAHNFAEELIEQGFEDKFHIELSALAKEEFDYEACRDHLLKHLQIHRENIYGVNKVAQTLIVDACYHGTLSSDEYIYWGERATNGTIPAKTNNFFNIKNGLFRKIRVGFVSYDFRAHSVGKFIISLFDEIDNNTGIETYLYYTFPDHEDEYTAMLKERADVFKSVGRLSDKQLRKILQEDHLDILVDLNGQTAGTKIALITERFAPIQITWMGFPFSSFHHNIDYIIGDYFFDDDDGETENYCSEKILRMDPCYMCLALGADIFIDPEPPQVKNGYITFGMMNNPNKYSEEAIRTWQRCLEAVPNSRLLIQLSKFGKGYVQDRMIERFKKFGLDMSRVDIGDDAGQVGYYRTYNKCDVMLESFPFGGATTTAEAIWMGVPVIGCAYHMRHGRMTYSFMNNVGLGDLCAESIEAYPEKVKEVAENVETLRELRKSLRGQLKDTPLYDRKTFRRAFENAIRDAFADYLIENGKTFDSEFYIGNDKELLKDCVRAADTFNREATRELGQDETRLVPMLNEYVQINSFLLERFSKIYADDASALNLVLKAAELIEMLGTTDDLQLICAMVRSMRAILTKFA